MLSAMGRKGDQSTSPGLFPGSLTRLRSRHPPLPSKPESVSTFPLRSRCFLQEALNVFDWQIVTLMFVFPKGAWVGPTGSALKTKKSRNIFSFKSLLWRHGDSCEFPQKGPRAELTSFQWGVASGRHQTQCLVDDGLFMVLVEGLYD